VTAHQWPIQTGDAAGFCYTASEQRLPVRFSLAASGSVIKAWIRLITTMNPWLASMRRRSSCSGCSIHFQRGECERAMSEVVT
jgi:hypothetical protein